MALTAVTRPPSTSLCVQLAPRAWLPRHASEHNLRALLAQVHLLATVLCSSVQGMLDQVRLRWGWGEGPQPGCGIAWSRRPAFASSACLYLRFNDACLNALLPARPPLHCHAQDPSGGAARRSLQGVLQRAGQQLGSAHSWQHRELRNPLMDASLAPQLQLGPAGALALQGLANLALQAEVAGRRPVRGVLLLYGPHLLWSSLPARDTAALFALVATGLLHATPTASNGSSAAPAHGQPELRALDGGCWQQLPSGFLALRGSLDAAITGEGAAAVQVPLVHLQHCGAEAQRQDGQEGADGGTLRPCHLLPLLEGKLLLGLLVDGAAQLTSQLLGTLHALLAAPAKQLAAQVRGRRRCVSSHGSRRSLLCQPLPAAVFHHVRSTHPACLLPSPTPPRRRWARNCA